MSRAIARRHPSRVTPIGFARGFLDIFVAPQAGGFAGEPTGPLVKRDDPSGSRGTRTHRRGQFATCFQDRPLIQPDGCRRSPSSGGWNRTSVLLGQNQVSLPPATAPDHVHRFDTLALLQVRGGGFEPPRSGSKPGGLPLADPRECPAGVEPACPAWEAGASPLGQGHIRMSQRGAIPARGPGGGRRGSRTPKAHRSAAFEAAAITNWLALPLRWQHRGQESNLRAPA